MDRALLIIDNSSRIISSNEIQSRKEYQAKYKSNLFCPNTKCKVPLLFQIRNKTKTKYFKKWPNKKHIKGCPYEHELGEDNYTSTNSSKIGIGYNISNRHIKNKLDYTYEQFFKTYAGQYKEIIPIKPHNKDAINKKENSTGSPMLFNEGKEIIGNEPKIYTKYFDNLLPEDQNKIICLVGIIKSFHFSDNHAYINLIKQQEYRVSIYFSEYFKVHNDAVFNKLDIIGKYISKNITEHMQIIVCCVGKVRLVQDQKGTKYNIHPDRGTGFTIDGYSIYQLLNIV